MEQWRELGFASVEEFTEALAMLRGQKKERVWSPEQGFIGEFFEFKDGHLVVRARAGCGKTSTIIWAIDKAKEKEILLAAFAKRNAIDLQGKLKNPNANASTLHSLGYDRIKVYWPTAKPNERERRKFLLNAVAPQAPDEIQSMIVKLNSKGREINPFASKPSDLERLAVQFDCIPAKDFEDIGFGVDFVLRAAFAAMVKAKEKTDIIDFSDMIYLPLVLGFARPKHDLIVIDEAQDMSMAQLTLAQRSLLDGGRLVVVGDDRQAIYAFRGADSGSLDRLKGELHAPELGLKTTYRCPQSVVNWCQQWVPDFQAHASNKPGHLEFDLPDGKIAELCKDKSFVLSRTNAPLAASCLQLLRKGIKARIMGKDIGNEIRSFVFSFKAKSLDALIGKLAKRTEQDVAKLAFVKAKDEDLYNQKVETLQDRMTLVSNLAEGVSSINEMLARVENLFSDEAQESAVMCSTVHKAKGLESENVFILGDTFKRKGEEEDNIKYVAASRSMANLYYTRKG